MPRKRTGSVIKIRDMRNAKAKETWYARVTFVDETTKKRREIKRAATSKAEAKDLLQEILAQFDNNDGRSLHHEKDTFEDLAQFYKTHFLKEAEYVNERKVSGLRSLQCLKSQLDVLRAFFGQRQLRSITYNDIRAFRSERLKAPTRRALDENGNAIGQRSIASVNRELAMLRKMLNIAEREGWIVINSFKKGESLISNADETKRERVLKREEEIRLLNACTGRRTHLKPVLICALDTAMRKGEILTLCWDDVDFENEVITIKAFNTKTAKKRQVSMTKRLRLELGQLYDKSPKDGKTLVFGINNNVKRSFEAACLEAQVKDFKFHDCRHTAITRMIAARIPAAEVMKISGHTQISTFMRYLNPTGDSLKRAASALDDFHLQTNEIIETFELVN